MGPAVTRASERGSRAPACAEASVASAAELADERVLIVLRPEELGGEVALASFPVVVDEEMFRPSLPSLTLGETDVPIELLPESTSPAGAGYYGAK